MRNVQRIFNGRGSLRKMNHRMSTWAMKTTVSTGNLTALISPAAESILKS